MQALSSAVRSTQAAPYAGLPDIVRRHLAEPYRRAPSEAGRKAFDRVREPLAAAPFVLDAGCGTGAGTFELASWHPGRIVIGVDKSEVRLAVGQRRIAGGQSPAGALLLRCELVDFWQMAAAAGLRCSHQYLLYPNPWPKQAQLMRRWHAHPVLPCILALGGVIELRTNWRVYAEEFTLALKLAGARIECCGAFVPDSPLTPFERKYAASGHELWQCRASAASTPLEMPD